MGMPSKQVTAVLSSSLLLSLLMLAGCNKAVETPQKNNAVTAAVPQSAPYQPPTADQLSQMVAPVALFPDKLVGQVLAGATYPDQITAADRWLGQNPALRGAALQNAENGQPWDVSVKSLTTFPGVLDQMASNIQWTTTLGQAYVNDPSDVMNAIQVLRSRAQRSGNLATSQRLRVVSMARAAIPDAYVSAPGEPVVYAGPAVVQAPPQTIVIESAEPDVVYVPQYNPTLVYGAPVPVYPGWHDHAPRGDDSSRLVTAGALSFGAGILVGAAVSHHDGGGWHSWGMNWGGPGPSAGDRGGWRRPAVVYNNATYVSKSVTVVNEMKNQVNNAHVTNVVNNNRYVENVNNHVNNAAPSPPQGMMSMPHFNHHDAVRGTRAPVAVPQPAQPMASMPPPMPHPVQQDAHRSEQPHAQPPVHAGPLPSLAAPDHGQAMREHQYDHHRDHNAQQGMERVAIAPSARPFAPPQAAPSPHHDSGAGQPQAHQAAVHPEHADHAQHAEPAPHPQAHGDHAQHANQHENHEKHENQEKHEHEHHG